MGRKTQHRAKAPLPEYFDAENHGAEWHLFCKRCGKGWSLQKSSRAVGNILHLLNHVRSHDEPQGETDE